MKSRLFVPILLILLTMLAARTFARADDHQHMTMTTQQEATGAAAEYSAAMVRMHQGMMQPATGNPDVDFAQGMIPHHQGAIDMANIEIKYGKDPEMKKLAQDILRAQGPEIEKMHAWLDRQSVQQQP